MCLFGTPRWIAADGTTLTFVAERPFQLLAYLARKGDWVTRDHLAALFWPDRRDESARSNLRKIILGARQLVGAALESRGDLLRLAVDSDVSRFKAAVARDDLSATLQSAPGEFLRGMENAASAAFSDWLQFERTQLHGQLRRLVLERSETISPGSAGAAVARLLEVDPYDEEALRLKLRLLIDAGDRNGAQRALAEFEALLQIELGIAAGAQTRALLEQLHKPERVVPASPAMQTQLIGRERALQELDALLSQPDCRLLTITGPAGIGKTCFARHVAATRTDITWVELADLRSVDHVVQRLADALRIAVDDGNPLLDQLQAELRDRAAVLILDNAEHLVGVQPATVARFETIIEGLLGACPRLRLLVTSRARLNLASEWLLPLPGLQTPASGADSALQAPAARLFVARALRIQFDFDPRSDEAAIGEICRLTAGLPLALELCAGLLRVQSCAEIAADLRGDSRDSGDAAALLDGQLHEAFERSWQRLAPAAHSAFSTCALFVATFTREAAQAVANASVAVLARLIDQSLLEIERGPGSITRFRLHPLLRQFALSKLKADANQLERSNERLRAYYREWLASHGTIRGPQQVHALLALETEMPNLRAVWHTATVDRDARFLAAAIVPLMYYFEAKGRRREAMALFEPTYERLDRDNPAHADALANCARALSMLLWRDGAVARALAIATEGIALARRAHNRSALKGCLLNFGLAHWQAGNWDEARAAYEEALALAREEDELYGIAVFVGSLAIIDHETGAYEQAERRYRESLAVKRRLGEQRSVLTEMNNLGQLLTQLQRYPEAEQFFAEGLQLAREAAMTTMQPNLLFNLGTAQLGRGDVASARHSTESALALLADDRDPALEAEMHVQLAQIELKSANIESAQAQALLGLQIAATIALPPLSLLCLSRLGEVRLAQARPIHAARLFALVAAHPKTLAGDRADAAQRLAALPSHIALTGADAESGLDRTIAALLAEDAD